MGLNSALEPPDCQARPGEQGWSWTSIRQVERYA